MSASNDNFEVDPKLDSFPIVTRTISSCNKDQSLKIIRSGWGIIDYNSYINDELKSNNGKLSFTGMELNISSVDENTRKCAKQVLIDNNLDFIGQIITDWPRNKYWTVQEHIDRFNYHLNDYLSFHNKPILINVHAGRDHWSLEESVIFYKAILNIVENNEIMKKNNIPISFETHRGCACLYSPWLSKELLIKLPELRITADLSHWILVSQRFFDLNNTIDKELIELMASRCIHIHSRYGHEHTPQINNPLNNRWKNKIDLMEEYWTIIFNKQAELGNFNLTIESEFGPAESNYMAVTVQDNKPVVEQVKLVRTCENRIKQLFTQLKY